VADGDLVIAAVASPELHAYEVPPEAVIVALDPLQMAPSLLVLPDVSATTIDGVGNATTVTVAVVAEEQLFASVTVTV